MTNHIIKKEEFRWSFRKKGTQVLNICTHLLFLYGFATALMMGTSTAAFANPTGGVVAGGAATITNTPTELQINQTSQNALINWQSFNIAAGETTHFYQPNSNAVALNRVVNSTQLSSIEGNLLANGHVLVINPNGVLIGNGAHVDTAGFIASSADIADSAFMNSTGKLNFNIAGNPNASVVNQGNITVEGEGLVALVAPTVRNDGIIQGNLAKIQLGAADTFGVDLYGDGLLSLAVSSGTNARTLKAENNGSIITDGGKVLMTAAAASNVVDSVINNTGVVQAQSLVNNNGEIILTGAGAKVTVSGKLDVSGANGGGDIKVGGDYQGGGTLAHADTTTITSGAVLDASATDNGNGGTAVVWSDNATTFQGAALAKGGVNGGDGGLVETSTNASLNITGGVVNTTAANGNLGEWLLDPTDVVIHGGTADGSDSGSSSSTLSGGGTTYGASPSAFTIYESEIEGSSTSTNITIQATHGVTTVAGGDNTVTLASGSNLKVETRNNSGTESAAGAGIDLSNLTFQTTGSGKITVQAATGTGAGNVKVGTLTSDTGSITLSTDNGSVTAAGNITTNKGSIALTSGNGGSIATKSLTSAGGTGGTSSITLTSDGALTVNGNINVTNTDNPTPPYYTTSTATLVAQGDINVTGNVNVSAIDTTTCCIGSTATLVVNSANGNIALGGTVNADAEGVKTFGSTFPNATSNTTMDITASSGSVTIAGAVTATAHAEDMTKDKNAAASAISNLEITGEKDVVIGGSVTGTANANSSIEGNKDAESTVQIISFNGGLWLAGAAPKAQTDWSEIVAQDKYQGAAVNHTVKDVDSDTDISHLILSGHRYTLDVNATPGSKTYGSADPTLAYSLTSGSLLHGDTFSGALSRAAGNNVGTYLINQGTLAAGVNYVIVYTGANFVINPATLTISALTDTKTYDGNTSATGATPTVSGLKYSDTVTGATEVFGSKNVLGTNGSTLTVNGYTINDGNGGHNYTVVLNSALGTINAAGLTITALTDTKTYDGNTSATGVTPTVSGLKGTDTVTGKTEAFASKNVLGTNGSTLNVTGYTVNDGNGGHDYKVTLVSALGTINPASLTISAVTDTKTYDGTRKAKVKPTELGLIAGDTLTGLRESFVSKNVLGTNGSTLDVSHYKINDGNDGHNYTVTLVSALGTINPATLTINAVTSTKTYDGTTVSTVTPTVSGLKKKDTVTGLEEAFASKNVLGTNGSVLNVDGYTVNDGNGGHNYTVVLQSAAGTINPASLTIEALTDTKTYDGTTTSTVTPTVTGLKGSDTVTGTVAEQFDSKNAGSRTLSVETGYVINDGNGGHNYAVTLDTASGTINKAGLTIDATGDTKTYDGTTTSTAVATETGLAAGDTLTLGSEQFDSKNAGSRTLSLTGYTLNDGNSGGNYNVTVNTASGTINKAGLTIDATGDTKTYDGTTTSTAVATETGLVVGDTLALGAEQFDSKNAGSRTLSVTGYTLNDGNSGGNYNVTVNTAAGTINKAGLTINATSDTKNFDGTTTSKAVATETGLISGDTLVIGPEQFSSPNPGARTLSVTGYTLTDGNDGGNYNVTLNTATGTINAISPDNLLASLFQDSLGRPIISVADKVINFDPPFEPHQTQTLGVDISLKLTTPPTGGNGQGAAGQLANIEPAAGGDDDNKKKKHKGKLASGNPKDLANIEPAAGGNGGGTGGAPKGNFACADDFLDGKGCTAQ